MTFRLRNPVIEKSLFLILSFLSLVSCSLLEDAPMKVLGHSDCAEHKSVKVGSTEFFIKLGVCIILVLIGGLIAGLTLGLMSLDSTNLRILATSGDEKEKKYAKRIQPIRQNGHFLLVTLQLTNTLINETLPILMDDVLSGGITAILVSTSLIFLFGEIIPQSICTKYGLAIGAFFAWPVRILMFAVGIIAYPLSKLLDWALGKEHGVIYRRSELKELVVLHGDLEEGPLTKEEVAIIKGALDLEHKIAATVMTEMQYVFSIDYNGIFDKETLSRVVKAGHSRIPVYDGDKSNIIGAILIKSLILVNPDENIAIKNVRINRLPKVPHTNALFDILQQFKKGNSHMALVYNQSDAEQTPIGIITLEDVIEELLQEEIIDETDVYVDIKTREEVVRALNLAINGIASKLTIASNNRFSMSSCTKSVVANGAGVGVGAAGASSVECGRPLTRESLNDAKGKIISNIILNKAISRARGISEPPARVRSNTIARQHIFTTPKAETSTAKISNKSPFMPSRIYAIKECRSMDEMSSRKNSTLDLETSSRYSEKTAADEESGRNTPNKSTKH